MKSFRSALTALLAIALVGLVGCTNVPAGNVAVKVNTLGDDRGVQPTVLGPGRYFDAPNTQFFLYPTFVITDRWTKDDGGQDVQFQAAGGVKVGADQAVSFHVKEADVPKVFTRYRRGVDEISDTFLRSMVRDEMNRAGIEFDVEALQAAGKQKLLDQVTSAVRAQAAAVGITVEDISYLSELRLPANVVEAINAKIKATQDAMKVENELRSTRAEGEKVAAKAEAEVRVAKAEAAAIAERGRAYRDNPQVLQLEMAKLQAEALRDTKVQILGQMPTLFRGVDPK